MSGKIILKHSAVAAKVPGAGDLELGELAVNTTDGALYMKKGDGSIVNITGEGSGSIISDADTIFKNGFYRVNDTTTNIPEASWGSITISGDNNSNGILTQTYTVSNNGTAYTRGRQSGNWSPWRLIGTVSVIKSEVFNNSSVFLPTRNRLTYAFVGNSIHATNCTLGSTFSDLTTIPTGTTIDMYANSWGVSLTGSWGTNTPFGNSTGQYTGARFVWIGTSWQMISLGKLH